MTSTGTNAGDSSADGRDDTTALARLKRAIASQNHLFACGGAVPIREHAALHPGAEPVPSESTGEREKAIDRTECDPITIRWDTTRPSISPRLTLPLAGLENDIENLIQDAYPATFARAGEDVFDESYRKALQLNASEFCSTFNPYALGIIDQIAQLLLPSTAHSPFLRAVRAELYKLNIYSGPSGKFKPHVDTPRSPRQFGSLVVCLPIRHEGGRLQVRHKGEETTFDWGTSGERGGRSQLLWAAFYSDCEHEVLEVTSGHRLTLTYNLYAVRGAGQLAGVSPILDPTTLPLFTAIEEMLKEVSLSDQGGKVGFFCSHAYAHTRTEDMDLPDALKGFDMVIWESFRARGLAPRVVPVLRLNGDAHQAFLEEYKNKHPEPATSDLQAHADWKAQRPLPLRIGRRFPLFVDTCGQLEGYESIRQLCHAWSRSGGRRQPRGFREHQQHHRQQQQQQQDREAETDDLRAIRWLTKPSSREIQLIYTAYGNEATAVGLYSHVAILVDIPSAVESGREADSLVIRNSDSTSGDQIH